MKNLDKTFWIAMLILVVTTFLSGHIYLFNLFITGGYVGWVKSQSKGLIKNFFWGSLIVLFLDAAIFKSGLVDDERGVFASATITLMSSAMLAGFTCGIAWVVGKFRK